MKDSTKRKIANELYFIFSWLLKGFIPILILSLLLSIFWDEDAILWLLATPVPLVIAYCVRLYKWIIEWKN